MNNRILFLAALSVLVTLALEAYLNPVVVRHQATYASGRRMH
jgi:hypothetical protein